MGRSGIARRVRSGRLYPIHRGVYAVGHGRLGWEGRCSAAVLACGRDALLSHASAAALWGLLRPMSGPIHVSVRSTNGRAKRRGIRLHRVSLQPSHVTRRFGIPLTTVARTIADLSGTVAPYLVRRAIRQAEIAGLRLDGIETNRSRSDLEDDFLDLCRRYGLPRPEVNPRIGRWTVDFLWRAERVAVETDSFAYHRGGVAFEDDHARDLDLRGRGYEVRRFTGRQIREESDRVAADLADVLSGDP